MIASRPGRFRWLKRTALGLAVTLSLFAGWVLGTRWYKIRSANQEFDRAAAELDQSDPGWRWEEITASSLVKIDVDGRKIDDSPHRVNPAGFTIHSAVHAARHDAACVIHTHTKAGMAVSAMKDGLLPISQIALQYYGRLGVHDYEGIALDLDERQRVTRDLGGSCGLILRNHGLLTVGRSVAEAFSLMFYLNLACEVQVATLSMGAELVIPPKEVCEKVGKQYDQMAFDDGDLQLDARFSTLALRAGTPNSLRHTSASTAMPSRICSCDGLAKHSRNRLPA